MFPEVLWRRLDSQVEPLFRDGPRLAIVENLDIREIRARPVGPVDLVALAVDGQRDMENVARLGDGEDGWLLVFADPVDGALQRARVVENFYRDWIFEFDGVAILQFHVDRLRRLLCRRQR